MPRKLLQVKAIAIENDIRGLLLNFGLKVGMVGAVKVEARKRRLNVDEATEWAGCGSDYSVIDKAIWRQIAKAAVRC